MEVNPIIDTKTNIPNPSSTQHPFANPPSPPVLLAKATVLGSQACPSPSPRASTRTTISSSAKRPLLSPRTRRRLWRRRSCKRNLRMSGSSCLAIFAILPFLALPLVGLTLTMGLWVWRVRRVRCWVFGHSGRRLLSGLREVENWKGGVGRGRRDFVRVRGSMGDGGLYLNLFFVTSVISALTLWHIFVPLVYCHVHAYPMSYQLECCFVSNFPSSSSFLLHVFMLEQIIQGGFFFISFSFLPCFVYYCFARQAIVRWNEIKSKQTTNKRTSQATFVE